ncbi:hypothetical protein DS745_12005 [Anaerobacillus alkaliphilus]|uniref:Uncharacterized protein n=1 Tax=Anaerobacillus alkaliphilus TaxID=1548597 RepID=A0A4Q0VS06_9BACI|nr:tetratricopeptide repeat protein [Anaerobacillus alkaliphilus]RXJ00251.1 hypothetical protein DS745_12005 [Anaerobacillus alkaliphilus]
MEQNEFLLYDHQKQIRLQAEQVSFYLQGQIIEAFCEKNEVYYLLFYKTNFLTAFKPTRLRRNSYIERAFKKGQVYPADFPFIHELLSSNNPCQVVNFEQLLRQLKKIYTPQEKALILTFLESFIPKKQLFNEILAEFYEHRRNGQMLLGYQIIRILMDFAPKHSLIKQQASDRSFNKHAFSYDNNCSDVMEKDSIYAEKVLYSQKEQEESYRQLVVRYQSESRWLDLMVLSIYQLKLSFSELHYASLKQLLEKHFDETKIIQVLEQLFFQLPNFLPLQKELFHFYIKTQDIEKLCNLLDSNSFQLSSSQVKKISDILEGLDFEKHLLAPDVVRLLVKSVLDIYPEKTEKLLSKCIIWLLSNHEPAYIKNWLQAFRENPGARKIYSEVETMEKLNDDLDHMQILGQLYFQYKQFEKAIECFSWEMELEPNNPKPLQWLSKVYREKGMAEESDMYRQLCISIQKQA